jgi:hypothetical protein
VILRFRASFGNSSSEKSMSFVILTPLSSGNSFALDVKPFHPYLKFFLIADVELFRKIPSLRSIQFAVLNRVITVGMDSP